MRSVMCTQCSFLVTPDCLSKDHNYHSSETLIEVVNDLVFEVLCIHTKTCFATAYSSKHVFHTTAQTPIQTPTQDKQYVPFTYVVPLLISTRLVSCINKNTIVT